MVTIINMIFLPLLEQVKSDLLKVLHFEHDPMQFEQLAIRFID